VCSRSTRDASAAASGVDGVSQHHLLHRIASKPKFSSLRMPSVVFVCDQRHAMLSQIGSLLRRYWGTIRWPSWRCCGGPVILPRPWKCSSCSNFGRPSGRLILSACFYFPSGGATPTLQRNAAYFCLSFARLSLARLFALGRVLT
jgi:hypothetical protein